MLGAFHHGIVASSKVAVASGTWKVKSGSYTGNGGTQSITGLGFTPQLLFIKATSAGGNDDAVMAWSGMANSAGLTPAATVVSPATAPAINIVTSYDADGFSIDNSVRVNTAAVTYYYFAIAGSGSELQVGNYIGTSTDDTDVTGVAFRPKMVMVRRRNSTTGVALIHEGMTGDFSYQLGSLGGGVGNIIQAINSNGFQVGTSGVVNVNPASYDYIALNPPSGYGYFSAYTGIGIDNSDMVTGLTFSPKLILVKGNNATEMVIRGLVNTGDDTTRYGNSTANNTNRIQQINSDGFQVGTNPEVNSAGVTYHYAVFRTT